MLPVPVGRIDKRQCMRHPRNLPEITRLSSWPRSSIVNRKSSIENYLRACLSVIDRNPEGVEKALTNKSSDAKGIRRERAW